jgi:transcriptional activator SPT7
MSLHLSLSFFSPSPLLPSLEPKLDHPPPPPFVRIRNTDGIIKLLQPYFKEKLEKSDGNLVEDEYLPVRRSRPRYPPILTKVSAVTRKRPLKDTNGDLKKSKKKKPMEIIQAERAEKKKAKQEARAQKVAEREQKKKLREELKERDRQAKLDAKREKV